MRTGISLTVTPAIRRHLKAVAANRNSPQKHVWRAQIVLLTAEGVGTSEIMRQTGKSKTCVWRWQERFMAEGFDGLLRDKTRPSRVAPLGADVAARVVALTQTDPPAETTHWTAPMMAQGDRHQRQFGSAHLACAWAAAAPGASVQAFHRSQVRRETARRGRPLCRSARPRHRPVVRREKPNPSARPHPAGPSHEEGPRRNDDPRLQAPRHHDPVRRAQRARRHRHRPQHAAPPASGVHPLPQHHRSRGSGRKSHSRHPRQLRGP